MNSIHLKDGVTEYDSVRPELLYRLEHHVRRPELARLHGPAHPALPRRGQQRDVRGAEEEALHGAALPRDLGPEHGLVTRQLQPHHSCMET